MKDGKTTCRWRWELCVIIITVLIVGALIIPGFPVHQSESRIDRVTGSIMKLTSDWFGLNEKLFVDISPLEVWMIENDETFSPDWQPLSLSRRNFYGGGVMAGSNTPPPIYRLRPAFDDFIAISTDEEIIEFVRIMESGIEEEQRKAVIAVEKKLFP